MSWTSGARTGTTRTAPTRHDGRALAWLGGLSLDLRLGARMLVKYPGLTVVGGLAMAFAIWVGVVVFEMGMLVVSPTLPLPGGDRLVQLRNWDAEASGVETQALHDFGVWRQSLRSVVDVGAWQDVTRNLTGRDGEALGIVVAEMTASGFRAAATPPLLGRTLLPADERPGAPPVLVLGHDVWQARFAADSGIVGRSVQLGDGWATVVGVMPDGFTFPVSHDAWAPFRPPAIAAPRQGPGIAVFGRLAPGVSMDEAQAELAALGQRASRDMPETHRHLRPQVGPYTQVFGGAPSTENLGIMTLIQLFALMLVVLVCGNVALLLFARAATRESEIVVRTALGASRRRIVVQLFAEALVLGAAAAAVGLGAAHVALRQWGLPFLEANMGRLPFWYDPRLSPATVLYACALTLLGAAIAGGLPGLKVTRGLASRLRQGTAGAGGVRFGGVWTAVIVAQVAVTVAFPAVVLVEVRELQRLQSYDPGFVAGEYLAMSLALEDAPAPGASDADKAAHQARFAAVLDALRQRAAAEPGVGGVTFVNRLPRDNYADYTVELDSAVAAAAQAAAGELPALREAAIARIDLAYFDVLRAPVLAGRGFQPADLAPDARVVIVDQGFVDHVLQGRNPIGQRVRLPELSGSSGAGDAAAAPAPWYQIVGVVPDLGMGGAAEHGREAGVYLPAAPGDVAWPYLVLHAPGGEPLSLVPRLRAVAGAVDPTLQLSEIQRLDQVTSPLLWVLGLWLRSTIVMTAVALLLSLAGIYAVLSFTVARRTREIGVRVALGASRRKVLGAVFRRPLTQVGIGVLVGAGLVGLGAATLFAEMSGDGAGGLSLGQVALLAAYAAFMLGVCLLACVVPTRRALGVEPTVALRAE